MIDLSSIGLEQKVQLWNILQKYLHELSAYCDIETDPQGSYVYKYFDAYFTDAERKVYFIQSDHIPVGFVMINPHSYISGNPDHVLAEFSIFPEYRNQSIGTKAAEYILSKFKGRWEIKFSENNIAAKCLWEKVTARYKPAKYPCGESETVLSFSTS